MKADETVDDLRQAVASFVTTYNSEWLTSALEHDAAVQPT